MRIDHISVSRRDTYKLCKYKYKLQYHLKVKSPEAEPFYFHYGTIIHKIAEEYVRNKGQKGLDELTKSILGGEMPLDEHNGQLIYARQVPTEYKQRMPEHLRSIHKITEKLGFDGELEYEFKYDLDPPNGKLITGFIDRLFQKNDNWYIIDYKTTKDNGWRKTSETIKRDLQLRCYSRVVQKLFNVPADKISAALYYLEGGNLLGAKFSQTSLDSVENELLTAYDEISATNPDLVRGNVGPHCKRCEFKTLCPFYRGNA